MTDHIYVYTDYVHNNDILLKAIKSALPDACVEQCDAADIMGGILTPDVSLLVMPGGADLYFCEKLDGAGNTAIKAYVEDGGGYLGICAGAYYGASELKWAEDIKDQSICGARELSFYEGTAIGPIFEYIEGGDFEKSWDGIASVIDEKGHKVDVLYRGGCIFESGKEAEVLLRYADLDGTRAAAVKTKVGSGRAVLVGPHLEFTSKSYASILYKHRNAYYGYERSLIDRLAPFDSDIQSLWHSILRQALSA